MTSQEFRIGTYNLFEGGKTTYNRLVEFARDTQLDVLCLQELNGWQDDDLLRCKDFSDKILFLDFSYANTNTEYKLATFTKHATTAKTAFVDGFWHGVAVATIKVGDQEITIANLHLDPWKEESRVREIDRLLQSLDLSKPTIITGDFNSLSRADNYPPEMLENLRRAGISKFGTQELVYDVTDRIQQAGFIDVAAKLQTFETTVPSSFNTDKDHELPVRIDYFYASPDLAAHVTKLEVIKNELTEAISDHYPVVATFNFGSNVTLTAGGALSGQTSPIVLTSLRAAGAPPGLPPQSSVSPVTGVATRGASPASRTAAGEHVEGENDLTGPQPQGNSPVVPADPDGMEREPDGSVVLPLHLHDDDRN